MRKMSILILFLEMALLVFALTGCWSYREVDKLAIVLGMAIDKGENDNYLITVEIVNLQTQGKDVSITSKRMQMEGQTIFDALRNTIKISGKRLYFSHIKVLILSKEVAMEGIVKVLDFFSRDSESRLTLHVLVSKEKTAAELLSLQSITSDIRSFELNSMLRSQSALAKSPQTNVNDLINSLSGEGVSAILPAVGISINEGTGTSELSGAALVKKNRLLGFLDENETRYYLFIVNKVKGSIVVDKNPSGENEPNISFEVFNSRTKVKPLYNNGKLIMDISLEIDASIGELGTTKKYIDDTGKTKLKKDMEIIIEENIKKLIEKVKYEYDADIFGFGLKVKQNMPNLWRELKDNWDEEFKNLDINVDVKVNIRNTGLMMKSIKAGD